MPAPWLEGPQHRLKGHRAHTRGPSEAAVREDMAPQWAPGLSLQAAVWVQRGRIKTPPQDAPQGHGGQRPLPDAGRAPGAFWQQGPRLPLADTSSTAAVTGCPWARPHNVLRGWGTEGELQVLQLAGPESQQLPQESEVGANSPTARRGEEVGPPAWQVR